MHEVHPHEDELLELAFGGLSHTDEAAMLEHLGSCEACRGAYDEMSRTMDSVLPASPIVAPPAGFDARVLDRLDLRTRPARRPVRRRIAVLVAAAAVVGICIGAAAVVVSKSDDTGTGVEAYAGSTALRKGDGTSVGSVRPARFQGRSVIVMQIDSGPPGMHYTCRLTMRDGTVRDVGDWEVPTSGEATWIAAGRAVDRVELVTDTGKVWSKANLRG